MNNLKDITSALLDCQIGQSIIQYKTEEGHISPFSYVKITKNSGYNVQITKVVKNQTITNMTVNLLQFLSPFCYTLETNWTQAGDE